MQTKNFQFIQSNNKRDQNVLLIIFGWLYFQEKHMDKYRNFYAEKGFDVLTVRINVTEFLFPAWGSKLVAKQLMDFLAQNAQHYDSILFHAFSIGVYQMGEVLLLLQEKYDKSLFNLTVLTKLKGVICDSPVHLKYSTRGIAMNITTNILLRWITIILIEIYCTLFFWLSTKHYIIAQELIERNKNKIPVLGFISKNDAISDYKRTLWCVHRMHRNGTKVTCKCWDSSIHACHFYKYPQEYTDFLNNFLLELQV